MKKLWWLMIIILLCVVGATDFAVHRHASAPAPKAAKHLTYLVSLGDSVAAGDGLPAASTYAAPADCGLSNQAYPVLLAQSLKEPLKQFACSGAQVSNGLLNAQQVGSTSWPAQLVRAHNYLRDNEVVITAGMNDVGGLGLVQQCAQTDCTSPAFGTEFATRLAVLRTNLNQAYAQIKAARPAVVVVNLYYPLIRSTDTCFQNYGITASKINWINEHEDQVNEAIHTAASTAGFRIVHPDFAMHLLCDPTPWIQGLLDPSPLHPTLAGQQQIAHLDYQALRR